MLEGTAQSRTCRVRSINLSDRDGSCCMTYYSGAARLLAILVLVNEMDLARRLAILVLVNEMDLARRLAILVLE